jgi:hypothetical protein
LLGINFQVGEESFSEDAFANVLAAVGGIAKTPELLGIILISNRTTFQ